MSKENHDGEELKIPKVLHFCHPENFVKRLKDLPERRVETVKLMGMGFVFLLKSKNPLNGTITDYMVHNFEYASDLVKIGETTMDLKSSVKIGETTIDLKSYFKDCYDLPSDGKELQHTGHHKYDDLGYVRDSRFHPLIGMTLDSLWGKVIDEGTPDQDFPIYFMTALLQEILACSREANKVDTSFVRDLIQHSKDIKGLNWSGFFADHLIKAIYAYKKSLKECQENPDKKRVKKCPGNLHILNYLCADIVKIPNLEPPPNGVPWINYITDEYLEHLAKSLSDIGMKSRKSADHVHGESANSSPRIRVKPRAKMDAKYAKANSDEAHDFTTEVMGVLKSFARKIAGAEKQEEPEEQAASKDARHDVNHETGPKRKTLIREVNALKKDATLEDLAPRRGKRTGEANVVPQTKRVMLPTKKKETRRKSSPKAKNNRKENKSEHPGQR